jgi:type II restriction/modification system DNA methylase subunit YeeA
MDTAALKKFAQQARRDLKIQVEAKLSQVLETDSGALREQQKGLKQLQEELKKSTADAVIERVAYTWFNRFCALRFMDLNGYTRMGSVSPAPGFTQPEILAEAAQGHIASDLEPFIDSQRAMDLLKGVIPSADPQQEAYRMLFVAVCNFYNKSMPFMFEKIAHYTELLMPEDLLTENSLLNGVREALTAEACQNVELIGWLYQFYISEKKDQVFDDLKKNKKISAENIPAATQLFTPNWIVRYLVENSLGRLWMLNHPASHLTEKMDYYIQPVQDETEFLKIAAPEELKICDPACGSGHMLVYAFDLLFAIYEEEGYDTTEIPGLILQHNIYGIEIDERAGELAAFALVMKARERYRRFLDAKKTVQPNICVLVKVVFDSNELHRYIDEIGPSLFTLNLQTTLNQFEEVDNFGSLIHPRLRNVQEVYDILQERDMAGKLFLKNIHTRVMTALKQADYLSPKYHVVVANPPYMGGKGMNERLRKFAREYYPDSKSDLFSMFIERIMDMIPDGGFMGLMTPFNWMFLSSFEKLRKRILNDTTLTCLVRPELHAFFDSAFVSICGFTLFKKPLLDFAGAFIELNNFYGAKLQPIKALEAIRNNDCGWFYRTSATDLKKIPGSPIACWVSDRVREIFKKSNSLKEFAFPRQGMATTNNELFLRKWYEIDRNLIGFSMQKKEAIISGLKWFPINKGGAFRRWYGNQEFIVNYENDGKTICDYIDNTPGVRVKSNGRVINREYYFRVGLTWSTISSSEFSMRFSPNGSLFETKGAMCFFDNEMQMFSILGYMNTKIVSHLLKAISPTLDFHEGPLGKLPVLRPIESRDTPIILIVKKTISLSRIDWDSNETSWDFTDLPLLRSAYRHDTLAETYAALRAHWQEMTDEMQRLEEENNRIFIEAYGLQDELTPDVPLKEITLTCNPAYRYDAKKSRQELDALLLCDTMKEFISYAVACMFGRYSLDKPGLVLANQGESLSDYHSQIPAATFAPDADNVIPLLSGDWFADDIADRFRDFLRLTFGQAHYDVNLTFIETALGKDIRKYFLTQFYSDHIKRYKKRPIYWLFSSPNGSFNALIYMHRYRSDTVSIVLNNYLREFLIKLTGRKTHLHATHNDPNISAADKSKAIKELEKLKKMILELESWERDILFPLATQQVTIDLDDGVKVNYNKLGPALKKIPGLSSN